MAYGCFHGNGPYGKILTTKEPIRKLEFTSKLPCHIIIRYIELTGRITKTDCSDCLVSRNNKKTISRSVQKTDVSQQITKQIITASPWLHTEPWLLRLWRGGCNQFVKRQKTYPVEKDTLNTFLKEQPKCWLYCTKHSSIYWNWQSKEKPNTCHYSDYALH